MLLREFNLPTLRGHQAVVADLVATPVCTCWQTRHCAQRLDDVTQCLKKHSLQTIHIIMFTDEGCPERRGEKYCTLHIWHAPGPQTYSRGHCIHGSMYSRTKCMYAGAVRTARFLKGRGVKRHDRSNAPRPRSMQSKITMTASAYVHMICTYACLLYTSPSPRD